MTVFNLIRHKLRWPEELPRPPLCPAFSISRRPGLGNDGQQSTVQRSGGSGSALLQHSRLTRGKRCWGKGSDPECGGAQREGAAGAQHSLCRLRSLSPEQPHGWDRTGTSYPAPGPWGGSSAPAPGPDTANVRV